METVKQRGIPEQSHGPEGAGWKHLSTPAVDYTGTKLAMADTAEENLEPFGFPDTSIRQRARRRIPYREVDSSLVSWNRLPSNRQV